MVVAIDDKGTINGKFYATGPEHNPSKISFGIPA